MRCPADLSHGALVETATGRLYCPHQSHDGRPSTHPDGAADRSARYFTLDHVEEANR